MIEVLFQFTGQLADAAGQSDLAVAVEPGSTLGGVLETLAVRGGERFRELVFGLDGRLRPTLLVICDGRQVLGEKAGLSLDGIASVMLMSPIAGG